MLKVEPTGQHDRSATESGRNGNEIVAGAASESFARRLHHRQFHAVRQRRRDQIRYPTTAVLAADLQHLHGTPRPTAISWGIVNPPSERYLVRLRINKLEELLCLYPGQTERTRRC